MPRKKKNKRRKRSLRGWDWFASFDSQQRRRFLRRCAGGTLVLAMVAGICVLQSRLEAHVESQLRDRVPQPTIVYEDLPQSLQTLALADLTTAVGDLLSVNWMEPDLCQRIAERLALVGWVEDIRFVRRRSDGSFAVRAQYRLPEAMVRSGEDYFLIDSARTRLPGRYLPSDQWKIVLGVEALVPQPGLSWTGDELKAGLELLRTLSGEPYAGQIHGVDVGNLGGRNDSSVSHIALVTGRTGERILWGSAPGSEVAENSVRQKLAILRENHRRTGRLDAGYAVIDISTYPDRFTIPG